MATEPLPEHRYPWCVRWARARGLLEVRDVFTGEWHQVEASQVPDEWRWEATQTSRAERAARGWKRSA